MLAIFVSSPDLPVIIKARTEWWAISVLTELRNHGRKTEYSSLFNFIIQNFTQ